MIKCFICECIIFENKKLFFSPNFCKSNNTNTSVPFKESGKYLLNESFVKIPDGGLSGLVELTWNGPFTILTVFNK